MNCSRPASARRKHWKRTLQNFLGAARQRPELSPQSVYSSYTARTPQVLVQIDREKAKSLGVPFSQINTTLQTYMGSTYVNDFDFNNRSYRVYVQADQQFRVNPANITQYYVRSDSGAMVPLSNFVTLKDTAGPSVISHYNLFRSAEINGSAAPGYSSGQALAAMEDVAHKVLPPGYSLRVDRPCAGGDSVRQPGHSALRTRPAGGLSCALRAV